jgi:AcrR family transcriptional regulator
MGIHVTSQRLTKEIKSVVMGTKSHKDIFAVSELIEILRRELSNSGREGRPVGETVLLFTQKADSALSASPIYSDALMRELYKSIVELAVEYGAPREEILEDLLFQNLKNPQDHKKPKKGKQKNIRPRILQAALDEFSEKGYHAATIDSIAFRAGIAKGTVYRYFKTKQDLFIALKERTLNDFEKMAREHLEGEQDALKIIDAVIDLYLGFFETHSAFFKVIVQEQQDFGREFAEKFINELINILPGLKRSCWRAAREGRLKQMNYFTAFFGIMGFMNGVIQKWLSEGGESALIDEAEIVKEILFYGIVKGREGVDKTNPLEVIQ